MPDLLFFGICLLLWGALVGALVITSGNARDARRRLRVAEYQVEELREYIWLVTAPIPTRGDVTKAGALPTQSVKVERSRHLNNVEDN